MNYQPKVIRCRLKTGGKTIQEIREKNKGQGMVYRDFENIKKTYDILDGVVLLLSLWDYIGTTLKSLRPIGRRKPMTPEARSPLTRRTWKRSKRFAKRFYRRRTRTPPRRSRNRGSTSGGGNRKERLKWLITTHRFLKPCRKSQKS